MSFGPPKIITSRDLLREEIPWLPFDIARGSVLYRVKDDYGCITPLGIAVSMAPRGEFYFEIPADSCYNYVGYVHSLN